MGKSLLYTVFERGRRQSVSSNDMWCAVVVAYSVGRVAVVGVVGDNSGGGIPLNLFYILPRI